jgi:UDP-N-acetylmuramate--alanine ligase
VNGADLIVATAAARADNVELAAARARGIPVIKGAVLLGQLMAGKQAICVAGTHGKTTTTAMIASILMEAGLDPSYVVGGEPRDLPASGHLGHGPHFVAEADEFDRRFLSLHPSIAVVTNVEADHPDCFPTMPELMEAYRQFLGLVPSEGWVLGCGDDRRVRRLQADLVPSLTRFSCYGLRPGNEWLATQVTARESGGSTFAAARAAPGGTVHHLGAFALTVPGKHNVSNALAAIAVASLLDVDMGSVQGALARFRGVARRFEIIGDKDGVTVVDSYAHHPTEIRADLAAARQRFPRRRVVAVHQPHTYSRLKALLPQFATAFGDADEVVIVDIYAARELDALGTHARDLAAAMRHPAARYAGGLDDALDYLRRTLRPQDVLITLGAGDVNRIAREVAESGLPRPVNG